MSVLFDGGNQSGMLSMYYAARAVIERAQAHGLALVAVSNLWKSGRTERASADRWATSVWVSRNGRQVEADP